MGRGERIVAPGKLTNEAENGGSEAGAAERGLPDGGIAEEGELFRTHIAGSALTEGVMMRGKLSWAVAVREPGGGIYLEEHDLRASSSPWRRVPVVRGCISFVESMVLSAKAMAVAADHAYDGDGESFASRSAAGVRERAAGLREPLVVEMPAAPVVLEAPTPAPAAPTPSHDPAAPAPAAREPTLPPSASGLSAASLALSMATGLLLGVALFVAVPVAVANLVVGEYTPQNALVWNLVEAALRVAIFVAYIWGVGRMPEMARVFGYHGAEHLAIHCFEHGLPLTPENAARFSRLHVRCGTAFLIMTMLVAIVVNTFVPVANWADHLGIYGIGRAGFVFVSRLVLLPLVAGLSYEVTVRWAGSHPEMPLVRVVLWPGLQMQRLTTRVPDRGMLECAIAALRCVRAREERAGLSAGEPCC